MIEFMILGAPRSGTTWAANWLTTDTTLCLHDPLWTTHYQDLDTINSYKTVGVACTGLARFEPWVNRHSARKVILHRPLHEINASLKRIGLDPWPEDVYDLLHKIKGHHFSWRDLFDNPAFIYEYLIQKPFDAERHALLKDIEMQPNFTGISIGKDVTRRLMNEVRSL
jgi:hypothetical protein